MTSTFDAVFRRGLRAACALLFAISFLVAGNPAAADEKKSFTLAWSIYAGWMPWPYAEQSGILKKWADKYGITIKLQQLDYIEAINQYTAGQFDAVLLTNMDALTIPAAGGVDTSIVIVGDYSNGNDGLLLKGTDKLADIKGRKVNLVELSVSHYFLARALESVGLTERDITVVNTSDADIAAAWTTADVTAAAAWNPQLAEMKQQQGTHLVYDSSQIPGEILDAMAINTATLAAHPEFAKALTGAWFETVALMNQGDAAAAQAKTQMAAISGTDLAGYESQLATTKMFYTPQEALDFVMAPALLVSNDLVRKFSFERGLLGEGAADVDVIGIEFPGGKVLGDAQNIRMRFDARFVQMAAEGKL
jgi:NitT/TauT family transport system substrate-binding protein